MFIWVYLVAEWEENIHCSFRRFIRSKIRENYVYVNEKLTLWHNDITSENSRKLSPADDVYLENENNASKKVF